MLKSMTGFGGREVKTEPFGKISVELRSTNHKFLEIVLHAPEGFLSLEDKIKKEIEARLGRGRVTCAINISGEQSNDVFINRRLLKKYVSALKDIQAEYNFKNEINPESLIKLPGVLVLEEKSLDKTAIWPHLRRLLLAALDDLVRMRKKEGLALQVFLQKYAAELKKELLGIRARFKKVMKDETAGMETDEERSSFLKDADITEEIERLDYHIKNLKQKLSKNGAIGKELDFIAQEMQRETNTIGAKSCDTLISAKVVQMKSQIEKIREQAQNIE